MNLNELPHPGNTLDTRTLFDEYGRCLPAEISAPVHHKTRRYFVLNQPAIDCAAIHTRTSKHLGIENSISLEDFTQRASAIVKSLIDDPLTRDIVNGVGVPFLLPKAHHEDYGDALENVYIKAVSKAFHEKFPQYTFSNHHKGGLAGTLGIAAGSRHERLLQAMQQGVVVGYYFPCLTEYSLPATIERMANLPEQFLLAGGYDTSAALIGSPDLLLRTDGYPPLLWLAALQAEKPLVGYHYEAYGYNLTFNRRPHFGQAAESWASGLVVLG